MDSHDTKHDELRVFDPEAFRAKKHPQTYDELVTQKWKNRQFLSSLEFAWSGVLTAYRDERNMRKHLAMGLLVLLMGGLLRVSWVEWLFLLSSIFLVVILEMVNSAIENVVDLVCGETYSIFAKNAKDMAAGAVLLMSVYAAVVGMIVFLPKLAALLF